MSQPDADRIAMTHAVAAGFLEPQKYRGEFVPVWDEVLTCDEMMRTYTEVTGTKARCDCSARRDQSHTWTASQASVLQHSHSACGGMSVRVRVRIAHVPASDPVALMQTHKTLPDACTSGIKRSQWKTCSGRIVRSRWPTGCGRCIPTSTSSGAL